MFPFDGGLNGDGFFNEEYEHSGIEEEGIESLSKKKKFGEEQTYKASEPYVIEGKHICLYDTGKAKLFQFEDFKVWIPKLIIKADKPGGIVVPSWAQLKFFDEEKDDADKYVQEPPF